jgi:subtilisin family serine protease
MFSSTTLTTKTSTATGYTLSGLVLGYSVTNIYNSAGVLLEQDFIVSKTSMIKYIPKADGTVEQQMFLNGKEYQADTYSATNKMISSTLYATDGITVKEIDTYDYTSKGLIADKIRYTATNTFIEKVANVYNSNNTLNQLIHTDINNKVTEIDYFNNGILDHITKNPVVTTTVAPYVPAVAPIIAGWSGIDGYGNINILRALSVEIGKTVVDVTAPPNLGWGITASHFDDAWAAGYTGKGIVIADIDTGVDLKNTALTSNLSKYNWNFVNNTANVQDDNGHGSFTASEMVATNIGNGVVGASYDAQLMVLKALNASGSGSIANIANAITYAVDHGANVINMSLGGTGAMPQILTALQYAQSHNVFVAIAAGNSLANTPDMPAFYAKGLDTVVAVGSSANNVGSGLSFSTFSDKTGSNTAYDYVTAPGTNIKGYNQSGQVVTMSGTSMATAYTSAAMAILEQASIALTPTASHATLVQNVMGDMIHNADLISLVGVLPIPTSLA